MEVSFLHEKMLSPRASFQTSKNSNILWDSELIEVIVHSICKWSFKIQQNDLTYKYSVN